MKNLNKKNIIFKTISLGAVLVLNVGLCINLNKGITELDAYSTSNLPTTIDLNDCTEEDIRSYYAGLNSLSESERQGTNLLKNLKPILSNNQKYYSYDSGSSIWKIYEIADRDWEKSPASSTTYGTYSAITNKITGYKYGSSANDSKNNPYIHALYINRNIENQTRAWGNHNQDAWGINREHIWAKSHGFDIEGTGGARGDPMHLWAANGWANHEHSNYFFAFVDKTRSYSDAGTKYNTVYNNLTGYSLNAGGNQTVFEPQDSDKGDIARAVFYMVARYNNYAGANSGFDTDNPNLVMLNNLSENSRTGTSSANDPYGMGLLSDLLAWNKLDPVDEYEIHRNNLLYRNYTNNRNPFIDFPSWADAIWGTADLDGKNYDSTVTSFASPANDPINTTTADAFGISTHNLDLQINETAEIYGRNANSNITWTVSDNTVISLNKNSTSNNERVTVTALKSGSATITATSGGDSVNCVVNVSSINYGTAEHPLTVDEAVQVISLTGNATTANQLYVKGIVSSNSAYNTTYHNYDDIWLQSDDGLTAQRLYLYRISVDEPEPVTYQIANSMVGKEVLAHGYATYYNNSKYELYKANDVSPVILSISEPPAPGINDYLNNASQYIDLLATENNSGEGSNATYQFATSGLDNESYITDLSIGAGVTINGYLGNNTNGNKPRFYDNSGKGEMRIYKGNFVVFTSSTPITRVEFTFSGASYSTNFTANVGLLSDGLWTGNATTITFINSNSDNTQNRIRTISVTTSGGELTLSNVAMRFGMVIPKADWNAIHNEWPITNYGVMIVKETTLKNTYSVNTIEEAYNLDKNLVNINKGSYEEPWAMDEDNYAFSIRLNFTDIHNYDVTYCASPYIVADGTYYFLGQIETSVNDLANDLLINGGSTLSEEALTILSTTN